MRKVRQSVMASRSDRDPPSLHEALGPEARWRNEARIGRFHQGQRARPRINRPDTKLQSAFVVMHERRTLRTGRRPYKLHEDAEGRGGLSHGVRGRGRRRLNTCPASSTATTRGAYTRPLDYLKPRPLSRRNSPAPRSNRPHETVRPQGAHSIRGSILKAV